MRTVVPPWNALGSTICEKSTTPDSAWGALTSAWSSSRPPRPEPAPGQVTVTSICEPAMVGGSGLDGDGAVAHRPCIEQRALVEADGAGAQVVDVLLDVDEGADTFVATHGDVPARVERPGKDGTAHVCGRRAEARRGQVEVGLERLARGSASVGSTGSVNGSSSMNEPLTSTQCSLLMTSPLLLRSSCDCWCSVSSTPTRRMLARPGVDVLARRDRR